MKVRLLQAMVSPWFSHAMWSVLIVGAVLQVGLAASAIIAGDWIVGAAHVLLFVVWTEPVTRPFRDATLQVIRHGRIPLRVDDLPPELMVSVSSRMVIGLGLVGKPVLLPHPPAIATFSADFVREHQSTRTPADAAFPPSELTLDFVNGSARYRLWSRPDADCLAGQLIEWVPAVEDVTVVMPGTGSMVPARGH